MSTIVTKRPVEPGDFYQLPDDKTFDFIDGDLLVRDMSVESSWIAGKILRLVGNYAEDGGLGWVFAADLGCRCFPDLPHQIRKPHLTFVRSDRFSADQIGEGSLRVMPDLVVEVVSPNDTYGEVEEKVEMFHKVGVPLIWVVSPSTRTVRVVRPDKSIS